MAGLGALVETDLGGVAVDSSAYIGMNLLHCVVDVEAILLGAQARSRARAREDLSSKESRAPDGRRGSIGIFVLRGRGFRSLGETVQLLSTLSVFVAEVRQFKGLGLSRKAAPESKMKESDRS